MRTQIDALTLYHPATALVVFKPENNENGLYMSITIWTAMAVL